MRRVSGPELPCRRVVPVVVGAAVLAIATVMLAVTTAAASPGPARDGVPPRARIVAPTPTSILDVGDVPAAMRPAEPAATARAPVPAVPR